MSMPLCTPEKLECVRNIEIESEECLPQCSGVWVTYHDQLEGNISISVFMK